MKMTPTLLFLVVFVFSSIAGSPISFCEDLLDHDTYLDLSDIGINALKESFVNGASIKCLNLADNVITSVDPKAFDGISQLEYLNLSQNSIDHSNFVQLHEFTKLKTLILDNAISPNDWQSTRRHQQNYGYYDQRTENYERLFDSFQGVVFYPKLEQLSFSNYRVPTPIPRLSRFVIPNLTHLYLRGNGLENDEFLPNNLKRNLTHLYLDDNEVNAFSGMGLEQLRHLSLNNNKIRRLCSIYCNANAMSPRTMNSLENLSIGGNAIVAVDADAFADSINLVTLDLSSNEIEDFVKHTFGNMTKLENLKLDRNRLSRIPDICALGNLRTLSLDGNRINSIDETSFCNLPKLTYVNLRKNHLIGVASGTFGHLPALATLDLSFNDIVTLPEDWMGFDVNLEILNLDANSFNDIASMSLGRFNRLGSLSIGRNPLTSITVESLIVLPINTTLDLIHACDRKHDSSSESEISRRTTYDPMYG